MPVIAVILGGIGLFLLGMVLMTEGLKAAAGEALRDVLSRFTGGPLSAFVSGAALTALVQSSSATILATIGFVSAGLLTFAQAVGVIFGAAVGTTSTGWLVAFLGLKYSVSALAFPLVGIGALLRLLTRGRTASIGLALAGFGLIFVGIDTLQLGMQALAERIDFTGLRFESILHRVLLMLVGAAMTVVMQSSSAAVATTLAALHAGTIELEQAAALVIGQNIGTSVTAALASIGASVPARRTALSHVLFNSFSSTVAFLALPLFLVGLHALHDVLGYSAAASIAIFHTSFNIVGVALLLPFVERYAALIARLVPDPTPQLTRNLDSSVRSIPAVAVEAARRTVRETAVVVLDTMLHLLEGERRRELVLEPLEGAEAALRECRVFLSGVRSSPEAGEEYAHHLSVLHAVDHLERLLEGLRDPVPVRTLGDAPTLTTLAEGLAARLREPLDPLRDESAVVDVEEVERASQGFAELRRAQRPEIMARAAAGQLDPDMALHQLDAVRWLDRLAYHTWRIVYHLAGRGIEDTEGTPDRDSSMALER